MSGNVTELVGDWFGAHYYEVSPKQNPTGPSQSPHNNGGPQHICRGGSCNGHSHHVRAYYRNQTFDLAYKTQGFRLVLPLGQN